MMASIQFYGIKPVLTAADNRKCPKWAIFQNKQFLFKYEDENETESIEFLNTVLDNLKHSTAVYTLQFYEDTVKIKANTPHDGSFNFRLVEEEERQHRNDMYRTGNSAVLQKLEAIESRLNQIEEEEEDESEDLGGIAGIALGLLKEPEKLSQLITIGKSLLGMNQNNLRPIQGKVAGIDVSSIEAEKIHLAIETLKKNDPEIVKHLEKLAAISEQEKGMFKQLLFMLDKM